jgi:NAD+ kinase
MIWLLARSNSEAAAQTTEELHSFARHKNFEVALLKPESKPEHGDTLIVLGGDGTLIQAARRYADVDLPMVAINLGRLGYITGFSAQEARQALQALIDGELIEEARLRLSVNWGEQESSALNEALITSGQPGRICSVALEIDGQPASLLRGDGALVATPTGSTAYALSAGGPILLPGMEALVVVPVAPHSIRFRPLVIPPQTRLSIVPEEDAWLVLDGQQRLPLKGGTRVELTGHPQPLRLLKPAAHDHLKILRNKLHWGEWA